MILEPSSAPPRTRDLGRLWLAGWLAALVLRALWLALVNEPSRAVYSDMADYWVRAHELFERARWSPYVTFQGLGYPIVLGFLRRLWGGDQDFGVVAGWLQLGASMVALAGVVHLARRVAGPRGAAFALAIGAVHVPWIFFNSVYMPESMYAAVLAGLGLALLRLGRDRRAGWRSALLVGLAGAAGAWLKSLHLLIGPIAAVIWLFPLRRGWQGAARILVSWFAALALFFWIPHGALSYAKTGRFMASPPAGGLNFVEGKCPSKENIDSEGYRYWSPLFVQQGIRNTKSWPASFLDQKFFFARGFECIAERPVVLLESLDGIRALVFGNRLWPAAYCGQRSALLSDLWALLFSWPLATGVVLALSIGTVRAARGRKRLPRYRPQPLVDVWLALIVPVLSLFATVWILKSEIRFRVPFDVFLLPLAIWGWKETLGWLGDRLRSWLDARQQRAAAAGLAGPPSGAVPGACEADRESRTAV